MDIPESPNLSTSQCRHQQSENLPRSQYHLFRSKHYKNNPPSKRNLMARHFLCEMVLVLTHRQDLGPFYTYILHEKAYISNFSPFIRVNSDKVQNVGLDKNLDHLCIPLIWTASGLHWAECEENLFFSSFGIFWMLSEVLLKGLETEKGDMKVHMSMVIRCVYCSSPPRWGPY